MSRKSELALFANSTHKNYVYDGMKLHEMSLVNCLIDTGAGLNLDGKSILRLPWTKRIKRQNASKLEKVKKKQ